MLTDLVWDMAMTAKTLRMAFDRRAQALGVTRAQWKLLLWLSKMPDTRQVDLAEKLEIEPITVSRQLDKLTQSGLVERVPDPNDRRAWRLRLTAKAEPLLAQLKEIGEAITEEAFAGYGQKDAESLRALMARVRDNMAASGREQD